MTVKHTWAEGETFHADDENAHADQTNANTSAIIANAEAVAAVYTRPGTGIPSTDLAAAVQASLAKADSAAQYASIAALRAATASVAGLVWLQGYYAAGDGGGGLFRWDSSDTSTADNGGTIIAPTGGLSSTGRWKRVYEGWVNARWFGVNPSQTDNTAALQKAVTWVASRTYPDVGGVVFIPEGWYDFSFGGGSSGLSTITVAADNVLIQGEGKGSRFRVTNRARPNQVGYFFTFSQGGNLRGQGGGVKDINFYGNSMLKWCVYLGTWRNAEFENISAFDVHSGILDAEVTSTTLYGEGILVKHLDYSTSAGTCSTQYGVRFRSGVSGASNTWSDCWIEDSLFILCWDTGVLLQDVQRFHVRGIVAANNGTVTDTIDGSSKSGCLHTIRITCGTGGFNGATGGHTVDGVYLESQSGSETVANNVAAQIDVPTGVNNQTRYSRISNVTVNGSCGLVKFFDGNGFGRANNNEYVNRTVTSITSSATPAINVNEVLQLNITALAAAITSMTSGLTGTPNDGDRLIIRIKDNGTARAISWGASFVSSDFATLPTTTIAGKTHRIQFVWDGVAAVWVCTGLSDPATAGVLIPESFGAVGNGTADDVVALNNCFAAAAGKTVWLDPSKVYAHNDLVNINQNGTVVAGGGTLKATNAAAQKSAVIVTGNNVLIGHIQLTCPTASTRRSTLQDCKLALNGCDGVVVRDVTINGSSNFGLLVYGATNFHIDNPIISNTMADGLHVTHGSAHGVITTPSTNTTGDDGISVVSYGTDGAVCQDIRISGFKVKTSAARGVAVVGGTDIRYDGGKIDGTVAAAIYVACESSFSTYAVSGVVITDVDVANANSGAPTIDHGALLIYNDRASGFNVDTVVVSDIRVHNTAAGATHQINLLNQGAGRVTGVELGAMTFTGTGPSAILNASGVNGSGDLGFNGNAEYIDRATPKNVQVKSLGYVVGGSAEYRLLANLPIDDSGNVCSLSVSGRLGGWTSDSFAQWQIILGNRSAANDGVTVKSAVFGQGAITNAMSNADILVYAHPDKTASVYLKHSVGAFYSYDFDARVVGTATIGYTGATTTTTPTGTLIWSLSTAPKLTVDSAGAVSATSGLGSGGGYTPGGTDVAVADGGTGASTATAARTNLGLAIGTNVQAWDADLDTWATKTPPTGTVLGTTDSQPVTGKTIDGASNTVTNVTGNVRPVQAHTNGSETYTISGGTVTQITGTTINSGSYSPAVGDRILILNAPAATGAGTLFNQTTQPGNGIYVVTGNTTNLTLARSSDMSGSAPPGGIAVWSESVVLSWSKQTLWVATTPSTAAAFVYGTGTIKFEAIGGRNIAPEYIWLNGGEMDVANQASGFYHALVSNPALTTNPTITLPVATGTLATLAATEQFDNKTLVNPTIKNYTESVVAIGNTGTSKTIALTNGTVQTATLTGNCTFTMPTAVAGKSFALYLSTGAGSFTATFTGVKWVGGTAPTITATAARLDILTFVSDGTNWYGSVAQNYTP